VSKKVDNAKRFFKPPLVALGPYSPTMPKPGRCEALLGCDVGRPGVANERLGTQLFMGDLGTNDRTSKRVPSRNQDGHLYWSKSRIPYVRFESICENASTSSVAI